MKKLIPIFAVFTILAVAAYTLLFNNNNTPTKEIEAYKFPEFNKVRSCSTMPRFLYKAGIKRPIIDLSQDHYTGIVFYYGKDFKNVLHQKSWERFEHLGTYAIDKSGNIFLTPNPFISIKPTTFNLQKAIYKMDTKSGELNRWLVIEDIKPSPTNPYGLISIAFDCDDNSLYVSAIDKSGYKGSKGRVYKVDTKSKNYKKVIEDFDALTISILKTKESKLLLAGSAIDNSLYAFKFKNNIPKPIPIKVLTLPNPTLHIRKIKVINKNTLKLEAIKFTYSLIAATDKKTRFIFIAKYNPNTNNWNIKEVE